MHVLLLGASGRIGRRVATELLDRGHEVTGVSRSGEVEGIDDPDFEAVAGDATDPETIADLAAGHDAVASTLGPSDDEEVSVMEEMGVAIVDGLGRTDVNRLVWTGGAGSLDVADGTMFIDTDDFPDVAEPVSRAHLDVLDLFEEADDLEWSWVAPAAVIEPGERTGEVRTAKGRLVTDEDGESYVSMEDFAIAFVDELEDGDAIHERLGVGR